MENPITPPTPPTTVNPPKPPLPPTPIKPRRGFSVWRLVIGLLVVYLGVQLLAEQMGWTWAWAVDVWRFWPVFIILLGLSLIWRGRHRDVWMTIVVVLLFLAVSLFVPMTNRMNTDSGQVPIEGRVVKDINIAKDATATEAAVSIDVGAIKLDIQGGAENLVTGMYDSNRADLTESTSLDGTKQLVGFATKSFGHSWFWFGDWRQNLGLRLNNSLPITLDIDAGASTANIDLTEVMVKALNIDTGASTINLTFGQKVDQAIALIKTGATTINLTFPKELGVKLDIDTGVSTKTLPEFIDKGEGIFENAAYATATKKLDLTLDAGVSTIRAHWK